MVKSKLIIIIKYDKNRFGIQTKTENAEIIETISMLGRVILGL